MIPAPVAVPCAPGAQGPSPHRYSPPRLRRRLVDLPERLDPPTAGGVSPVDGAARALEGRERSRAAGAAEPRGDSGTTRKESRLCARGRGTGSNVSPTSTIRVERPRHRGEETSGPVTFTVGGFGADGSRVERRARAIVTQGSRVAVEFERDLEERGKPRPASATRRPGPASERRATTLRSSSSTG